ncbi:hypothetical protein [Pelagivirga sediminicola]|uniref:hypothetical protein n=1 Tax=Pelagivirga sediminicola TaxID=2170575 RepID=UPI001056F2A6|nr:hypothetical protein [Pelagivirga sediminicola]
MIRSAVFFMLFGFLAVSAQADDAQSELARQIEAASVTSNQAYFDTGKSVGWTLYPPTIYCREMQVDDCDVTALTLKISAETSTQKPLGEITFDLARTKIPDPSSPNGDVYAFMTGSEDKANGSAMFDLHFLPPYEPTIWSTTSESEVERPVPFARFLMEPVADETQPRRLLSLLNQYQAAYCRFSG